MSPMAIWSNEAQERYVLPFALKVRHCLTAFVAVSVALMPFLGTATTVRQLIVDDSLLPERPVDMPMQVLLGGTPK